VNPTSTFFALSQKSEWVFVLFVTAISFSRHRKTMTLPFHCAAL
jgi:hypothetical protein